MVALVPADWIAFLSATILAGAAWLSWKTYSLSQSEHSEARAEARLAPRRQRLDDVYRELKYLANEATQTKFDHSNSRGGIAGHQQRLLIALSFIEEGELLATRAVATSRSPGGEPEDFLNAAREIAKAIDELNTRPGVF